MKPVEISNLIMTYIDDHTGTSTIVQSNNAYGDIQIPNSVTYQDKEYKITSIKKSAFEKNNMINTLDFSDDSNVESIGPRAFAKSSLTKLTIPDKVSQLEGFCEGADNLIYLSLSLKNNNFLYLSDSLLITNPNNNNEEVVVLYARRDITSAFIPSNVDRIGQSSFEHCTQLQEITFLHDTNQHNSLREISDKSFCECTSLEKIVIPSNVERLGSQSFFNCKSLSSITFEQASNNKPSRLTEIASDSFYGCVSLKSIEIPENVKSIGDQAFRSCPFLRNVSFSDNSQLQKIGHSCFAESLVTRLSLPKNVSDLETFCDCSKYLIHMSISDQNPTFSYVNDCLLIRNTDMTVVYARRDLASLIIPSSVKCIGKCAFDRCVGMKSVFFNDDSQLEKIDNNAFSNCTILESICIPSTLKIIGSHAFEFCSSLHSVTYKDESDSTSLVEIGDEAFSGCTALEKMCIPSSVVHIGFQAFSLCNQLQTIKFDEDSEISSIDKGAISDTQISFMSIPDKASKLEGFCEGANNLIYLSLSLKNNNFLYLSDSLLITNPRSNEEVVVLYARRDITSAFIPSNVDRLGQSSFEHCTQLQEITFLQDTNQHNSLREISDKSFCECTSLEKIVIPSNVERLGSQSFFNCKSLSSITFEQAANNKPSQLSEIASDSFYGCVSLKSIEIPETVSVLNSGAFRKCSQLTAISFSTNPNVSSSLQRINYRLFFKCNNLRNIIIPANVTQIYPHAFEFCTQLQLVSFQRYHDGSLNIETIGEYAFSGCENLETFSVPHTVKYIASNAFNDCTNLKTVTFLTDKNGQSNLKAILSESFSKTAIKSITIPSSVHYLCPHSFSGCENLQTILFSKEPNGKSEIEEIAQYAFSKCYSLNSISIPFSIKIMGTFAFSECKSLATINFDTRENGTVDLPVISENAFLLCESLQSITIPFSITSIEPFAFSQCYQLHDVTFQTDSNGNSNLEEIGDQSFFECMNLLRIAIPTSVKRIGKRAFDTCPKLAEVTFMEGKSNLSEFGQSAFFECSSLTSITIPATVKRIDARTFYYCRSLKSVTFLTNENGLTQLEEIGDYSFALCISLTSIEIPKQVKRIRPFAFNNCLALETLKFETDDDNGSSLEEICAEAFSRTGIDSLSIPTNVRRIGADAFAFCTKLQNVTLLTSKHGTSQQVSVDKNAFIHCDKLRAFPQKLSQSH